MKKCSKCSIIKELKEFPKDPRQTDGVRSYCKDCRNLSSRARKFSPSDIKNKNCATCQLDKNIIEYYTCTRYEDGYDRECKDCRKIGTTKHYKNNTEKIKERHLTYYYENKDKVLANQLKRQKERLKQDPFFRLKRNLRNRLYYALKNKNWKKNTHLTQYLGCEREVLISHIELQFQPGMTWDNYGQWEIDHIKPLANAVSEQELYNLCHYTNLQPLWKLDNVKKSNKA